MRRRNQGAVGRSSPHVDLEYSTTSGVTRTRAVCRGLMETDVHDLVLAIIAAVDTARKIPVVGMPERDDATARGPRPPPVATA